MKRNIAESQKKIKTERSILLDSTLFLSVLAVLSAYYYGTRAIVIITVSCLTCLAADYICFMLRKSETKVSDYLGSLNLGLILALMMPASASSRNVATAAVFAVIIGRQAFGGSKNEIFSPAAVGFLFTALCFPRNMLFFPEPLASPEADVALSAVADINPGILDVLAGKFPGPMGTTFLIIISIAAVMLIVRRSLSALALLPQIIILLLFEFFANSRDYGELPYILASDMTLFGLIFLSCDYKKVPRMPLSRLLYGIAAGLILLIFRNYSQSGSQVCAVVSASIASAPVRIELDRKALSFADVINKERKGALLKIRKLFFKNAANVAETLEMLGKDGGNEQKNTGKPNGKSNNKNKST